jgi:hypothetical protein
MDCYWKYMYFLLVIVYFSAEATTEGNNWMHKRTLYKENQTMINSVVLQN